MVVFLLLPLALILFLLLKLERRRQQNRKGDLPFPEAVATAVAQFKAGGIPYATCPSCSDVLTVHVDRTKADVGTMNVRCRCGGSNAVIRI